MLVFLWRTFYPRSRSFFARKPGKKQTNPFFAAFFNTLIFYKNFEDYPVCRKMVLQTIAYILGIIYIPCMIKKKTIKKYIWGSQTGRAMVCMWWLMKLLIYSDDMFRMMIELAISFEFFIFIHEYLYVLYEWFWASQHYYKFLY